jgi:hypothetical protein
MTKQGEASLQRGFGTSTNCTVQQVDAWQTETCLSDSVDL